MSKSILVFDNPNNCYECPCYKKGRTRYECSAYLFNNNRILIIDDLSNKPNDCPLKPMPQKLEYKGIEDDNIEISKAITKSSWYRFAKPNEAIEFRSFAEGYNDCIDEILGEQK